MVQSSCFPNTIKISAFVLHALASLVILGVLFGCDTVRFGQRTTKMEPFDWKPWKSGPGANATCNSREQCYRDAVPWADDEVMRGFKWNPYVLVFVFEWISASFALYYLRELRDVFKCVKNLKGLLTALPIVWNVLGVGVYVAWIVARDSEGTAEIVVVFCSFTFACVVLLLYDSFRGMFLNLLSPYYVSTQGRYELHELHGRVWKVPLVGPDAAPLLERDAQLGELGVRLNVVLRYAEYTVTASLLYVAVLGVFVVEPPGWMAVCGYVSIFSCNVFGIPLHAMHMLLDAFVPYREATMRPDAPSRQSTMPNPRISVNPSTGARVGYNQEEYVKGYTGAVWGRSDRMLSGLAGFFGIGKWKDFWVSKLYFLGGSWFSLMTGVLIILYVARGYLFSDVLPGFVLFALWNLIVTYAMFGFVGTVFYIFPGTWRYMDVTLDILSLAAKLPIAVDVCIAFLQMPGGGCRI